MCTMQRRQVSWVRVVLASLGASSLHVCPFCVLQQLLAYLAPQLHRSCNHVMTCPISAILPGIVPSSPSLLSPCASHPASCLYSTLVQVVSEVYALHPVNVEPHVVLSLVLYKMVDGSPEAREDALHMLHVLSLREWQTSANSLAAAAAADASLEQQRQQEEAFALEAEGGSGTVLVLGALQDSYQQFQYQLSVKLARCVSTKGGLNGGFTWQFFVLGCDMSTSCRQSGLPVL